MLGLIFVLVFLGVIVLLIVIAVYGAKKDKRQRQIDSVQKRENNDISKEAHKDLYLKLYKSITELEDELENFTPSVGIKTMKQINDDAIKIIDKVFNSQQLKDIYLVKERKEEIEPILMELKKIQPKKWKQDAFFAYNVVKNKGEFLVSEEKKKEKEEQKNLTGDIKKDIKDFDDWDFKEMKIVEIKELLTKRKIHFEPNMRKSDLVDLLIKSEDSNNKN